MQYKPSSEKFTMTDTKRQYLLWADCKLGHYTKCWKANIMGDTENNLKHPLDYRVYDRIVEIMPYKSHIIHYSHHV